jgi:hypothetical protein
MRALWNRFAVGWCRTFHPEPAWPIHGHYHCPACLRLYPVPWQEGTDFTRRAPSAWIPAAGVDHDHVYLPWRCFSSPRRSIHRS